MAVENQRMDKPGWLIDRRDPPYEENRNFIFSKSDKFKKRNRTELVTQREQQPTLGTFCGTTGMPVQVDEGGDMCTVFKDQPRFWFWCSYRMDMNPSPGSCWVELGSMWYGG